MDYSRVVLGIGNPGPDYEDTRHNAGFLVLDRLAERAGVTFRRLERRGPDGRRRFGGKVKAHVALLPGDPARDDGEPVGDVLLVKPLTYVNLSGDVAGPLLRAAGLGPESLFVVVDDLNLPLGRIRVRPAGSSGGHNGLKSIEQTLCTSEYPRLRLGIGEPSEGDHNVSQSAALTDTVDFVLARFLPEERLVLRSVLDRCADILLEWRSGTSVNQLMGRHNGFAPD